MQPTSHCFTGRYLLPLLLASFFVSCGPGYEKYRNVPYGIFAEQLKLVLNPVDTNGRRNFLSVVVNTRYAYQENSYEPIWIKESYASNEAAQQLVYELGEMKWDGFDPERYNLSAIKRLKAKLDTTQHNSMQDAIAFDTLLTRSYLAAARYLLLVKITPRKADSLWYHSNDSTWDAPHLLAGVKDKYPSLNAFRSDLPAYALLRDEYKRFSGLAQDTSFNRAIAGVEPLFFQDSEAEANISTIIKTEMPWVDLLLNDSVSRNKQLVTAYQKYNGIKATGKLDSTTLSALTKKPAEYLKKISANMERIRWMQKQFGSLYVFVDVPLMEFFLRKDGLNLMHMNVVVGRPERQTPSLFATMANIVINPSWGVPPTILKKDVLPGLAKDGKKYMKKKGLKVYDNEGNVVDPSFINEHNYKRYTYKQAPGDDNSLGYVKFNLPNPWDIYLHDTPHRTDFGKRDRFLSSGCIRLQQPQELAVYILSKIEHKNYTLGKLDSVISTHKTKWEILKTKIPVHIAYLTAFDDTTGKHIQFTRDIYHRDEKLISLLN